MRRKILQNAFEAAINSLKC